MTGRNAVMVTRQEILWYLRKLLLHQRNFSDSYVWRPGLWIRHWPDPTSTGSDSIKKNCSRDLLLPLREAAKKFPGCGGQSTKALTPPPLSSLVAIRTFFLFKFFFLKVDWPLPPPPPLSGLATSKGTFYFGLSIAILIDAKTVFNISISISREQNLTAYHFLVIF